MGVEAGLRAGDLYSPAEEAIARPDIWRYYHFCADGNSRQNLVGERSDERILSLAIPLSTLIWVRDRVLTEAIHYRLNWPEAEIVALLNANKKMILVRPVI